MSDPFDLSTCPVANSNDGERITLAHGEGARLSRRLIERTILSRLRPVIAGTHELADAAHLSEVRGQLAFTTDSYVVSPLFFPGGDIGRLAVLGTVNDLAVSGAEPLWLSLSLIIEEGLPVSLLERVLDSVAAAAREANVQIATGDTKVVPRGAADGLFINTSGIGRVLEPRILGPSSIQVDDVLIVTGPIGRHGLAILAAREQLQMQPAPESDCSNLWPLVQSLADAGLLPHVRAMRDATRGGVAAVLHEWAAACELTLSLAEARVPITTEVRGCCELLGLDPLYIANEGVMLLAVDPTHATTVVSNLQHQPLGKQTAIIGSALRPLAAPVITVGIAGSPRPLDEATGALLPRIC